MRFPERRAVYSCSKTVEDELGAKLPGMAGATLLWSPLSGPVTGYLIERNDGSGNGFQQVAVLNGSASSFVDTNSFVIGDLTVSGGGIFFPESVF